MSSYQPSQEEEFYGSVGEHQEDDLVELSRKPGEKSTTPRRTNPPATASASTASSGKRAAKSSHVSGSETERESSSKKKPAKMSSSRSSSSKHHSSSSSSKKPHSSSRSKTKTDDWADVTEPEERRRIQNRLAQRKFREKAREQKERAEREARNQEHAGSSYQIPGPDDLASPEELSGLPWGGPDLRYVVARGHETASQQGSRRASDNIPDESQYLGGGGGGGGADDYPHQQQGSWDGQEGDEQQCPDESPYFFDYDYDASAGGSSAR